MNMEIDVMDGDRWMVTEKIDVAQRRGDTYRYIHLGKDEFRKDGGSWIEHTETTLAVVQPFLEACGHTFRFVNPEADRVKELEQQVDALEQEASTLKETLEQVKRERDIKRRHTMTTTTEAELRELIAANIQGRGWTRCQAARHAGLYRTELNGWLAAKRNIRTGRLLQLVNVLGGGVTIPTRRGGK